MPSLNMRGPFSFTAAQVDGQIPTVTPGNYALGKTDGSTFIVQYVGRSDTDLNARLKQHLEKGYQQFKFSPASSAKAAFEKECQNYHDFGGSGPLDNAIHPDRPAGTGWKCPVCDIFG